MTLSPIAKLEPKSQDVLSFVAARARRYGGAHRIILFGSRARGDHRRQSDFDIAVDPDDDLARNWSQFWLEVDNEAPTLCSIDLVRLDDTLSDPLRTAIESEGIRYCDDLLEKKK